MLRNYFFLKIFACQDVLKLDIVLIIIINDDEGHDEYEHDKDIEYDNDDQFLQLIFRLKVKLN